MCTYTLVSLRQNFKLEIVFAFHNFSFYLFIFFYGCVFIHLNVQQVFACLYDIYFRLFMHHIYFYIKFFVLSRNQFLLSSISLNSLLVARSKSQDGILTQSEI